MNLKTESYPADAPAATGVLRLEEVHKSFPGVRALRGVTFTAAPGEVHALLGENGAGKSTLMAVAAGAISPDAGTIELDGDRFDSIAPIEAQERGLAIVRQDPALLPDLTVAENLAIAAPRDLSMRGEGGRRWMREELERIGLDVALGARIEELTIGQRQLIELAKALALEPKVLILDEPTAPLGEQMVDKVFEQVRAATARNAAVVYISHRLPEVRRIADRVTVMRDGEMRGSAPIDEMSDEEMLQLIVGRKLSLAFPDKHAGEPAATPALSVRGLTGSSFSGVDLDVGPKEIVGLAGIAGNGQTEFARALAGLERGSGEARLADRKLKLGRSKAAKDAGIVYLSADRHGEGLVMSLSVRENAALSALTEYSHAGFVSRREESDAVREQAEDLDVRTPSIATLVSNLSGGNQQKVALARALLAEPKLVIVDEPTQGVDAGARVEIYRNLREIAGQGIPVIVVSSDSLELEGLCDRIVVFSRGQVVAQLTHGEVTEEQIARSIVTANTHREDRTKEEREGAGRSWAPRLASFARGDWAPSAILVAVMVLFGAYTYSQNDLVLTSYNLNSIMLLVSALAFIAFGQMIVIFTGGIDLSVGPLAGMLVVIASFFAVEGKSTETVILGFLIMIGAAIAVGTINGSLVRFARFTPIAATLATYVALQGVSLLMRDTQGGFIATNITEAIETKVAGIPLAFIVAVALALGLEYTLRRTRWGLNLRAVGSREDAAHRLGVKTDRTFIGAYIACSCFTFLGAVMLMAQLGVGDPTQGVSYTLSSITAVVLGGASLFGGRGSFVGALLGAALLQQTINATTFLKLDQSWQYWIVGILVLLAAGIYTQARNVGRRA
jgi:ribose transport system ATP-binding protein